MTNNAAVAKAQAIVEAERAGLADLSHGYPANHFAWRVILDSAARRNASSLVEIGVGHGNGVAHVIGAGLTFDGIDRDAACVAATRAAAEELGVDTEGIFEAHAEDAPALKALPRAGEYDSLVALGILPSAADQVGVLRTMADLLRPGGEMFVECRNSAFGLVTFNRFSADFIVDDLLSDAPSQLRAGVREAIEPRVQMDRPPVPSSGVDFAQHNPFTVADLFEEAGLGEISVHPFHYHASLPSLEQQDPQAFRTASLAMEDDTSGWKGLFLCSAFLVRAVRQ